MFATITTLVLTVTPQGADRLAELERLSASEFERALERASRRKQVTRVASPTMKIGLGETGEFKSGARIPYTPQRGDPTIRFTEAEVRLSLAPITAEQDLAVDFDFHWTRPDFSVLSNGEPGMQMIEAKARVALEDGWTVIRTELDTAHLRLLQRPSARAGETLWLLFRGSLV